MDKIWNIKKPDHVQAAALAKQSGISPILAAVFLNRNVVDVETVRHFLDRSDPQFDDPLLMRGMKDAVQRIQQAVQNQERVVVFGDYDVDGVTSALILNKTFARLGLTIKHWIPHRVKDGYGLNQTALEELLEQPLDLLITIDCGTTSRVEVEWLKSRGVDVIVIDHHEPSPETMPDPVAFINPKHSDCPYPFKLFASAGLALKLYQAFFETIDPEVMEFAAVGTVADIVPLMGENRNIVKAGLKTLHQTKNRGLSTLMAKANVKNRPLKPYHIGFMIGPRINAAGRMDSAMLPLELFLTDDHQKASELAERINQLNQDRQQLQRNTVEQAFEKIQNDKQMDQDCVLVVGDDDWHKGVIGIVASRITDKFYRPSVVISWKGDVGVASARSVAGFHLFKALDTCSEHLEQFGGHQGAAGLTIRRENLEAFKRSINLAARRYFDESYPVPTVIIDADVPFEKIDIDLATDLGLLEPYGEGHSEPLFCSLAVKVKSYPQIMGRDTVKFWVENGTTTLSVVGFGMAKTIPTIKPGMKVDIAYRIGIDDWKKSPVPQLILKDIREISTMKKKPQASLSGQVG